MLNIFLKSDYMIFMVLTHISVKLTVHLLCLSQVLHTNKTKRHLGFNNSVVMEIKMIHFQNV